MSGVYGVAIGLAGRMIDRQLAPLLKPFYSPLDSAIRDAALVRNRVYGGPARTVIVGEVAQAKQHHFFGLREACLPRPRHEFDAHADGPWKYFASASFLAAMADSLS